MYSLNINKNTNIISMKYFNSLILGISIHLSSCTALFFRFLAFYQNTKISHVTGKTFVAWPNG